MQTNEPWEHPEWYDLHDTAWSAGSVREPEHYQEFLLSLPPLDKDDHLIDVGAGTGKLTALVAQGYPYLGHITVLEPNEIKLDRALQRLKLTHPDISIDGMVYAVGEGKGIDKLQGNIVTVGSVLMPIMLLNGGSLADGLIWLRQSLTDILNLVEVGGWIYLLETLGAPWDTGALDSPARRLNMTEFRHELTSAGLEEIECMYRFRDRVIFRGRKPAN